MPMRYLLTAVLLVSGFTAVWADSNTSASEADKFQKAIRLAERVYQETGDANGAAKVLEEAGVARLKKSRPAEIDKVTYIDVLETYAGFLSRLPARELEAASLLKSVIESDPRRASPYLSLGDLYYRLHQSQPGARYRSIYSAAYKKYIKRLEAEGTRSFLPNRVVESVYDVGQGGVCRVVAQLLEQGSTQSLEQFFNPEREIKVLDKGPDGSVLGGEDGISFAGLVQNSDGRIRRSLVDIDNNGSLERRYSAKMTQGGCTRNLFYQEVGIQTALLSNDLLDQFYAAGRVCGASKLSVMRYRNENYIVEQQIQPDSQIRMSVYQLNARGQHQQLCSLQPPTRLQRNLVRSCNAAICDKLESEIDAVVSSEGQQGVEWLVSDISTLSFDSSLEANPGYKRFIESQHQYLVDLDNDGERELISRVWLADSEGQQQYRYRLFKERDGLWQPWQLPEVVTAGAAKQVLDDKIWFFIDRINEKNYLVTFTATATSGGESGQESRRYELQVYLVEGGQLQYLGEISTSSS